MKVFISWSGNLSHQVALVLRNWFPYVLQQVRPYVSSEDIRKGNRWSIDIAGELGESDHGIICLTRENLEAPWIHFEAGALSKSLDTASVWTLLVGDLSAKDIAGPLAQFQHTNLDKVDFKKLIDTINQSLGASQLNEATLNHIFDRFWPELEEAVRGVLAQAIVQPEPGLHPERTSDAVLSELLDLSRSMSRSLAEFTSPEPRMIRETHNFSTRVTIVPTRDRALVDTYTQRCASDPRVRKFGLVAYGSGGRGSEEDYDATNVDFQSYDPIPKEPLLEIAAELGIEVVDILYDRIVFKREKPLRSA